MAKKSNSPEDFGSINRSLLYISYKQPFYDWLKFYDKETDITGVIEGNAYLLPQFEFPEELEAYLHQDFDRFFVSELFDWYTFPKMWPKKRNWALFNEWFDIKLTVMVLDADAETPIGLNDHSDIFGFGGIFDDDGTPIDVANIPIPAMCHICKSYRTDDAEENILCNLNRFDQRKKAIFQCYQYDPLNKN
jgi:hypothetical protein